MLAQAVVRMDRIYAGALAAGTLAVNPTLNADRMELDPAVAALVAAAERVSAAQPAATAVDPGAAPADPAAPVVAATVATFTVQFASPDAKAVDAAVGAVRSVPGVSGAATSSLAMGGTSVLRVTYAGSLDALAGALRARGYTVVVGSNALSIRK
jgi:hypothetical protein